MSRAIFLLSAALAASTLACEDGGTTIAPAPPPRDAGCAVESEIRSFDIYFVVDVSGSMSPFLESLSQSLARFAEVFPKESATGEQLLVSYYVVAFVNDVLAFPPGAERMSSHIGVSAALEMALERADDGTNLNFETPNSDTEENLLDALGYVIDRAPDADSVLIITATDADFREAPQTFSGDITVEHTYAAILAGMQTLGIRVHAYVPSQLRGLTQPYASLEALPAATGGRVFDLQSLDNAVDAIQTSLEGIAEDVSCNTPQRTP